jgi:hypothetical protein
METDSQQPPQPAESPQPIESENEQGPVIPDYLGQMFFYAFFSGEKNKWFFLLDHRTPEERKGSHCDQFGALVERWKLGRSMYKFYRHAIPYNEVVTPTNPNELYITLFNIVKNKKVIADVFHQGPPDKLNIKMCIKRGAQKEFHEVDVQGTLGVLGKFCRLMKIDIIPEGAAERVKENFPAWDYYKLLDKSLVSESFMKLVDEEVLKEWQKIGPPKQSNNEQQKETTEAMDQS